MFMGGQMWGEKQSKFTYSLSQAYIPPLVTTHEPPGSCHT